MIQNCEKNFMYFDRKDYSISNPCQTKQCMYNQNWNSNPVV